MRVTIMRYKRICKGIFQAFAKFLPTLVRCLLCRPGTLPTHGIR